MEQEELTEAIIACAYKVHNVLGFGFLEKVYENSLKIELQKQGFEVDQQFPISVFYDETLVGDFFADLLINKSIILELKAVDNIGKPHEVQLVNYLKATNMEIGLLINFGRSVQIKRKYKNPTKKNLTGFQDSQDLQD